MDDVEEGKKELITREITQFREQMKVRNTNWLFSSSETISWGWNHISSNDLNFLLYSFIKVAGSGLFTFYYFFYFVTVFIIPYLKKRVHIYIL